MRHPPLAPRIHRCPHIAHPWDPAAAGVSGGASGVVSALRTAPSGAGAVPRGTGSARPGRAPGRFASPPPEAAVIADVRTGTRVVHRRSEQLPHRPKEMHDEPGVHTDRAATRGHRRARHRSGRGGPGRSRPGGTLRTEDRGGEQRRVRAVVGGEHAHRRAVAVDGRVPDQPDADHGPEHDLVPRGHRRAPRGRRGRRHHGPRPTATRTCPTATTGRRPPTRSPAPRSTTRSPCSTDTVCRASARPGPWPPGTGPAGDGPGAAPACDGSPRPDEPVRARAAPPYVRVSPLRCRRPRRPPPRGRSGRPRCR